MLHIATIHWRSDVWIDAQLESIDRWAPGATTWASLDGIDPAHDRRFDHVLHLDDLPVGELPAFEQDADHYRHGFKLNELARRIAEEVAPTDHLLFLDGDALLLSPISAVLATREPLVAMRRDEIFGDRFPHPAFCLTTVEFWNDLPGDWTRGAMWTDARGSLVTDTGGKLLETLEKRDVRWRPLTRCNVTNLHPLWFGCYGDADLGAVVYHHGAGFRARTSRVDPAPGRDVLGLRTRAFYLRQRRMNKKVTRDLRADPQPWIQSTLLS